MDSYQEEQISQQQQQRNIWSIHQHIDCQDTCGKWLDAVIIDVKHVPTNSSLGEADPERPLLDIKVSYPDFGQKYDEWIVAGQIPSRVLRQWDIVDGQEEAQQYETMQVNNRIDVFDTQTSKWREARVIDIFYSEQPDGTRQLQQIKVHFKGLHSKHDEVIDVEDFGTKLSPISRHLSKRKGGKKNKENIENVNTMNKEADQIKESHLPVHEEDDQDDQIRSESRIPVAQEPEPQLSLEERRAIQKAKEEKFQNDMLAAGRQIVEVGDDGNCLFRSIALQAYGDEEQHRLVRIKCMEYIQTEKQYFRNFIADSFDDYIEKKKTPGEWGDDVEIQAMSEIYDRPIEIYAYDIKPMKTFHEQPEDSDTISFQNAAGQQIIEEVVPFRLSFHGSNHYNCILRQGWQPSEALLGHTQPGFMEDESISMAIDAQKQAEGDQSYSLNDQILPSQLASAGKSGSSDCKFEEAKVSEINEINLGAKLQNDPKKVRQMIQQSRQDFEQNYEKQIAEATKLSLELELLKQVENDVLQQDTQEAIDRSKKETGGEAQTEEEMFNQAMQQSLSEFPKMGDQEMDDEMLMKVLAESRKEAMPKDDEMSVAIQTALNNGYSMEQGIQVESMLQADMGQAAAQNEELVLNYLMTLFGMANY